MTRLIVAEKPSMGRAIAAALGLSGSGRSFMEGKGVLVTWCVGHLVEALEPESVASEPAAEEVPEQPEEKKEEEKEVKQNEPEQ